MRLPTFLTALVLLAATAGCLGGDDGDDPPATTTPVTTPTTSTPASPTPTTTTPSATTPEPTTPSPTPVTPPLPPKVIANQTFDFGTEGDPTGQAPKTKATDAVPEGYTRLVINVTLTRTSTGPTTLPISGAVNTPTVRVLDPEGKEVLAESKESAPRSENVTALPGAWSVKYEGSGTVKATVLITAHP